MKLTTITSCYIGPRISPERFISEHFFLFLAKGAITGYDGQQSYTMKAGEYCLARKNHLGRYHKQKEDGEFEKVVMVFDEPFLKVFLQMLVRPEWYSRHLSKKPAPSQGQDFPVLKRSRSYHLHLQARSPDRMKHRMPVCLCIGGTITIALGYGRAWLQVCCFCSTRSIHSMEYL